jgi:hypothetical protein
MTREEIDIMWQQALQDSVRDGEMFTRYHFAKMVAAEEREACEKVCIELGKTFEKRMLLGFQETLGDAAKVIRARGEAWTS